MYKTNTDSIANQTCYPEVDTGGTSRGGTNSENSQRGNKKFLCKGGKAVFQRGGQKIYTLYTHTLQNGFIPYPGGIFFNT